MRIIAGMARGRTFDAPEGMGTRPTLDRVRENVFNILQMKVRGASVLDLFSGSGAMAFEALSRGAESAVLVDRDRSAHQVQQRNAQKLRMDGQCRILLCDWQEALRRLLVADILFSAGPKKLSLFGDQPPLITTRSRAGQAAQERAVQLNVMQLQLEQLEAKLAQADEELAALTTPDLVGKRFSSPAFGTVTCVKVQGDLITLETQSGPQRLSQPDCFLKGHLVPEDEALVARYAAEQAMLARRRGLHTEIINLKCAISRLQIKP